MSSDAILPVVATALFLTGVAVLFLLMLNIFRELRGDARGRRPKEVPTWRIDLRRGIAILIALSMIGMADLTSWVNRELRLYSPVGATLPVGTITIMHERGSLPRLVYASIDRQGREAVEVFPVRDAVFRLQGERIRWSPRLKSLGLGEYFKLSRIEFYPQRDVPSAQTSFTVDVRQGSTNLFRRLKDYRNWLPFVEVDSLRTEIWDASTDYSRLIYLSADRIVTH